MDYFDILFAKTNGVSSSSCYSEIEAMLKSTVGHSSKNLFDISGTDITNYGVRWYEENGRLRGVGTYNDNAAHSQPRFYAKFKAGSYILSGSPIYSETGVRILIGTCSDKQGTNFTALGYDEGNGFTFTLQSDTWVSIRIYTAKELYQQSIDLTLPIMLRSGSISDDTFDPYVTPTDEKKQDKPVELDSTVLTFNIAEIQSKYETLKFVIEYTMTEITTIEYNVVEVPTFIFGRGDTSYYKIFTFCAKYARDNFDAISFTESDGNVTVNPYTASSQNIIKIIGIPK